MQTHPPEPSTEALTKAGRSVGWAELGRVGRFLQRSSRRGSPKEWEVLVLQSPATATGAPTHRSALSPWERSLQAITGSPLVAWQA